ncbi:MAG TPA: hypothetical protein VFG06_09815 [Thermodesulfovibrionales bacterium]|nr:hypothetical protein [Thermodesulfovibrionales bacterium]
MKATENQRSIKDWMELFKELYSQADSKRTPEQMWIAVMAHTSSIGESIRKIAFESLLKSAAHTFCWLCSFVNKCNSLPEDDMFSISESLCGIVSLKYPNACGHCTHSPCDCDPVKMEREQNKSAKYTELLERRKRDWGSFKNYSIESYGKMFDVIYCGKLHIQTLENIGFHFLEEVGEASVSVRQLSQLEKIAEDASTGIDSAFLKQLTNVEGIVENYVQYGTKPKDIDYASKNPDMLRSRVVNAKMDLVSEIGDSFSWFCAILNKLDSISKSIYDHPEEHPEIVKPLEQVLNNEYLDSDGRGICPSCKSNPCKCVFYNITIGK